MKRRLVLFIVFLMAFNGGIAQAQTPKIGLVLSGGGARGAAHVGVLKVLEEMRIPIHAVAGTSMGALVGGAYAAGVPASEIERRLVEIDWNVLLSDDPPRSRWPARRKQQSLEASWDFTVGRNDEGEFKLPKGALAGQQMQLFFSDLVQRVDTTERFDDMPIPYRAIATNLENGAIKVFDRGSLPTAMRASMSVPGAFAPVEVHDALYVDGGLVRNLPVDIARTMDVDVIIAINLGTSYLPREDLDTVFGVAGQMLVILTEKNVEVSKGELRQGRDLLIEPDLGDMGAGDFKRSPEAIGIGEQAARQVAPQLRKFSVSEKSYQAWYEARFSGSQTYSPEINEVRVTGTKRVNPEEFDSLAQQHQNRPLDRESLADDIQKLYATGDYERISYRVEPMDGRNLLIVDAVEKSWGPNYLKFGLGLSSDFSGDSRFGIQGTYRKTWVNDLGAEWYNELVLGNEGGFLSEFYQPLNLDRSLFVAPYINITRSPLHIYQEGERIARYDIQRKRLGLDIGTTIGQNTELRAGIYFGNTRFDVDTGDPILPEGGAKDSGIRAKLFYDTMDGSYVATAGQRVQIDARRPLSSLGATQEYTRLDASWSGGWASGKNIFQANLRGGTSFDDPMPYYDQFPLGGFLKLSGYSNEQFRGNQYAFASLVYNREIASLTPPLGRGLYVGGSLEAGRIWDLTLPLDEEKNRYGASVFFSADTFLGPFYLGWGIAAEGDNSFYLLLGRP